jgi:hypothetical protein
LCGKTFKIFLDSVFVRCAFMSGKMEKWLAGRCGREGCPKDGREKDVLGKLDVSEAAPDSPKPVRFGSVTFVLVVDLTKPPGGVPFAEAGGLHSS